MIDAADQLLMLRYLRGEATLTVEQRTLVGDLAPYSAGSGSVIGDDQVTAADAAVLARSLAGQDVDGDGLGLRMETRLGLSSFLRDSDADGILDPDEDFDQDGKSNAEEITDGSDPANPDSDADGLVDGEDEDPLAHAGTQVVFLHPDPLGSPAAMTDTTGLPVRQLRYGVYGELRANTGATGTPDPAHKYTGKRLDPKTGLADYGARWYDPALAVFTQPDPIVANPFDPQSLNRFAYVRGDPLNLIDPTGHWEAPALTDRDTWAFQRDTARMHRSIDQLHRSQRQFASQVARRNERDFQKLIQRHSGGGNFSKPTGNKANVRGYEGLELQGKVVGNRPPDVNVDPRGFSTQQVALIQSTVHFLIQNYPDDFGGSLDTPIHIVQRENLRDSNAFAETGLNAEGEIEIALHLDALQNPNNFRSILGHEFVHAFDIGFDRVPPTPAGDRRSELRGLEWEWRNAGRNQITAPFRDRLREKIREWRTRQ